MKDSQELREVQEGARHGGEAEVTKVKPASMGSTEQWACQELEKLGICDPHVIIHYLQPIEDAAEVEDYLTSLLDASQPPHAAFIREFVRRQQEVKESVDNRFYRKPDLEESAPPVKTSEKKKQKGPKEGNGRGQRDGGGGGGEGEGSSVTSPSTPKNSNTSSSSNPSSKPSSGKKKYTNLYSEDGANRDVVMLSGRHRCECQASKHRLVGNCLQCGRVVCQQEGSGPCQFCGALVMTREERELLGRGSKKSEALHRRLTSEKNATVSDLPPPQEQDALQKAVDHKNRLLEFDRTSERRTKVHDDESDYFNTNSRWLSEGDRTKLRDREEELRTKRFSRGGQTVTLDLANRRVVADEHLTAIYDPNDPLVKEVLESRTSDIFSAPDREESGPKVEVSRPMYRDTNTATHNTNTAHTKPTDGKFAGSLRVQDRELQEMRDEGVCLSMHQPWASLLITGIKLHEGRTWYSPHRGRLWIAAAGKTPQENEIRELENRYRVLLNNDNLPFPHYYPPGCLLGCVDVVDVLPQEEYRERFPDGDSQSPFVFICQNPQEMVLKFPIKGQHKIFKLDPKIHQTAKKALRPREE